VDLYQPASG